MLEGAFAKVIAIGLLLTALLAGAWKLYHDIDKKAYDRGRNEVLAQTAQKVAEAVNEARAEEQQNSKRVQDAQDTRTKSLVAKAADSASATSELERLRNEVRTFSQGGDSAASRAQRAATVAELFGACTERYEALAGQADGHVIDLKTLISSWPK